MIPDSPFTVLAMTPTLDPAAVKGAYFQQLARHRPQQDPEGFQRLRAAYEALQQPGGLVAAYFASPLDLEAVAAPYAKPFDPTLATAYRQALTAEFRHRQFCARASRLTYQEALKHFS